MVIGQGTLQRLAARVKETLNADGQGELELQGKASRARLIELIAASGRGEQGPLVKMLREIGLAPTLAALPSDLALYLRVILLSKMPRSGSGPLVNQTDPLLRVPGLDLYQPHKGQVPLHLSRARFRVAACGRRFGKTFSGVAELREGALLNPGAVVWWVAPVFSQAEKAFGVLQRSLPGALVKRVSASKLRAELLNGALIEFKSAEVPDNLRGEGLALIVVDEAALVAGDAWSKVLRPALSDRRGKALLFSTPKGRGWFFEMFAKGKDPGEPEYESFTFPSWCNPHVFPRGEHDPEIEALRRSLPLDVFRQEIMAEFLEDSAGVFRNVKDIIFGEPVSVDRMPIEIEGPRPGRSYVGGLDLARLTDWTVLCIMDSTTGRLVFMDRFNRLDWKYQKRRIEGAARRYDASLAVDASGIGDVILQDLKEAGVRVDPFKFTSGAKADLIQDLAVAIEQREIGIPDVPVLVNELAIFGYEVLPSGAVRYSAPEGHHDDCVIGLALAVRKLKRRVPWSAIKGIGRDCMPGAVQRSITDPRIILEDERY